MPGSVSFFPHEMARIKDAELFINGFSVQDLGYKVASLQLMEDVMQIRYAQKCLAQGKMPEW